MRMFQTFSIPRKLVLIIMITSAVTCLMASVAFLVKDVILYHHSMVHSLSGLTQVIGMNSQGALVFNDQYTAEKNLTALRAMPYVFSACVYDREGEVFATYLRKDVSRKVSPPPYQKSGHYFKRFEGNEYLYLFQPIMLENEHIGTVFIKYDLQEMLFKLKEALFIFGIIMLTAFFVAFMMSSRLQRLISEPILRLAQTTKSISQNRDYGVRAEKCDWHQDEIGVLIDGFNEMITEIEAQEVEIRRHRENELNRQREYLDR
ncbi:MAG: hypothetical protein BWK80_36545 [Desulfobacteraceae bacterium IS3]|nr:MAG: hypothetical protein BWK80_36545 [Desulfobacteraceae bacterium IS3]